MISLRQKDLDSNGVRVMSICKSIFFGILLAGITSGICAIAIYATGQPSLENMLFLSLIAFLIGVFVARFLLIIN